MDQSDYVWQDPLTYERRLYYGIDGDSDFWNLTDPNEIKRWLDTKQVKWSPYSTGGGLGSGGNKFVSGGGATFNAMQGFDDSMLASFGPDFYRNVMKARISGLNAGSQNASGSTPVNAWSMLNKNITQTGATNLSNSFSSPWSPWSKRRI